PYLRLSGREVSVFFSDVGRNGIEQCWHYGRHLLYEPVMFYWGEPRITCKQAHVIKRALERDQRIISDIDAHRRLIYPDWAGYYQRREQVCRDMFMACVGDRARAIATERTNYFNGRYRELAGINLIGDEVPKRGLPNALLSRQTRFYTIGYLSSGSSLHGTGSPAKLNTQSKE